MEEGQFSKDWPHEWIKKIRSRPARQGPSKRMRQVDLAKRVGVDPRTVQQWENGDRLPSVGNLKRIIQAFWEEGLFLEGNPRQEAQELWFAVKRFSEARSATHREFPDFDVDWFEMLATMKGMVEEQASNIPPTSIQTASRVPKLPTLFVGRSHSIEELRKRLHAHALVSIVGPGGIGKTSLAIEMASTLEEMYPHGVWMFEFGSITEPQGLGQVLLSTLGLPNQVKRTDIQTMLDAIAGQKVLFIFDNCEHIIDSIAAMAESLLAGAAGLTILTTSREPLNIWGESVYRIPPLTFPTDNVSLNALSEQEVLDFEAVQLFLERARIIAPQFRPTLSNLRLVCSICKKVEGIPLAIELAVARMNMLTLEQIEERLANLLTLLTTGKRTAAPRQQTLKSTIDWSYNLLTGKERLLLRRLSVFAGGFTLAAAEEICVCEPGMPDREDRITPEDMLDLLSGLVNKSLVSNEIAADYGFVRYFLLGAIKEYAAGKLREESEACKHQALLERHARYYNECLIRAEPKFRTREREACIEEVRREYTNLRSALQWSYQHPQTYAFGLHMVSHLYWFWLHEGRLKEGLYWLDRFLGQDVNNQPTDVNAAKALHGQGVIQFIQGNIEYAIASAVRSVELARDLKLHSLMSSSLRLLAFIHIHQKRIEEAKPLVEQSVEITRTTGDLWNLASSLHAYGKLRLEQKNYSEASTLLKESVLLFEAIQDQWEVSGPYECLGFSALKLGELPLSIEYFKKCIAASQIYRGAWVLSRGLEGLGITLCAMDRFSEASLLLGAAEKGRQSFDRENVANFPVEHQETLLSLRQAMSDQELHRWWTKGTEMPRTQAIAYALEI